MGSDKEIPSFIGLEIRFGKFYDLETADSAKNSPSYPSKHGWDHDATMLSEFTISLLGRRAYAPRSLPASRYITPSEGQFANELSTRKPESLRLQATQKLLRLTFAYPNGYKTSPNVAGVPTDARIHCIHKRTAHNSFASTFERSCCSSAGCPSRESQ